MEKLARKVRLQRPRSGPASCLPACALGHMCSPFCRHCTGTSLLGSWGTRWLQAGQAAQPRCGRPVGVAMQGPRATQCALLGGGSQGETEAEAELARGSSGPVAHTCAASPSVPAAPFPSQALLFTEKRPTASGQTWSWFSDSAPRRACPQRPLPGGLCSGCMGRWPRGIGSCRTQFRV